VLCRELHTPLAQVLDLDFATALRLFDALDGVDRNQRASRIHDMSAAMSSCWDGGKYLNDYVKDLLRGRTERGEEANDVDAFVAAFGGGV